MVRAYVHCHIHESAAHASPPLVGRLIPSLNTPPPLILLFFFGFPSVANQVMVLGQERSLHWPIPCSLRRVVTGWSDPDDAMVCRGVVWGVGVFLALDVTWILSRGVRINHT